MAELDLATALNMLKQGSQDLALHRAISGANEQVQQVKASAIKEEEKRSQLQQISNNLVSNMASIGTPATTMQMVAGAVGPKQFANANQMNMEGVLTGNQGLQDMAETQGDFEFRLADKMALAEAKRNPLMQAKMQEQKSEFDTKQLAAWSKSLDNTEAVRNAFGRTGQGIQRANQLQALIGKAGESVQAANGLPPQMIAEMATGLAAMVKGGQATDADVRHFLVNSVGIDAAKAKQYMTNGVSGANAGEFVMLYKKAVERERGELQAQAEDTVLKRAQGNLSLYKRLDPEAKQAWKQTVADRIGNISADDVIVDEKKGKVTTTQQQAVQQKTDIATGALKEAYAALKSADPAMEQKAKKTLQVLHIDPSTPLRQAMEDVKYKISRGLLQ